MRILLLIVLLLLIFFLIVIFILIFLVLIFFPSWSVPTPQRLADHGSIKMALFGTNWHVFKGSLSRKPNQQIS